MAANKFIQYFVEGECEEKFINAYKKGDKAYLKAGKVEVLNVVNKIVTEARARAIKQGTTVVFIYDIDKGNLDILKQNLNTIKTCSLATVLHVQSIQNFEDEIVFSTSVSNIDDVFSTKGVDNFKEKFIDHKDIASKFKKINFDKAKMWSRIDKQSVFKGFVTQSSLNFIRK